LPLQVARFFLALMSAALLSALSLPATASIRIALAPQPGLTPGEPGFRTLYVGQTITLSDAIGALASTGGNVARSGDLPAGLTDPPPSASYSIDAGTVTGAPGVYVSTFTDTGDNGTADLTLTVVNLAETFAANSAVSLAGTADLVFTAGEPFALPALSALTFEGVQIYNLTAGSGPSQFLDPLMVSYANGQVTLPAALFGQHAGVSPLTPGNYSASLMFRDNTYGGIPFTFTANFLITATLNPVSIPTLNPTGLVLLVLLVLALAGIRKQGSRIRSDT
jgi:hypothetical protein